MVDVAHADELRLAAGELGAAFAVRGDDGDAAAGHAGEEERRALLYLHHDEPAFELLRFVAHEGGPVRGAGDELLQRGEHLAAVAGAEREGVAAREEVDELGAHADVVEDRACPAASGAEHVAVGEAAAGDDALESGERSLAGEEIGHVHVDRLEARAIERGRHLDLAVYALLAQDGDAGPSAGGDGLDLELELHRETAVVQVDDAVVLL